MNNETEIKILETTIDNVTGLIGLEVERKILNGEITTIKEIHDMFYNDKVWEEMRESFKNIREDKNKKWYKRWYKK